MEKVQSLALAPWTHSNHSEITLISVWECHVILDTNMVQLYTYSVSTDVDISITSDVFKWLPNCVLCLPQPQRYSHLSSVLAALQLTLLTQCRGLRRWREWDGGMKGVGGTGVGNLPHGSVVRLHKDVSQIQHNLQWGRMSFVWHIAFPCSGQSWRT